MPSDPRGSGADLAPLASVQRVMQRLIRDPRAPEGVAADAHGWLAAAGLAPADVEAMGALGEKRLLLYRKLVQNGLRAAIRLEMPRAAARLGGAFDAYVDRFFEEELPRSHYLRDVAFELFAWAAPRWAADPSVPAYVAELARHELLAYEVACSPARGAPTGLELELERPVRFDPAARLVRYEHAIHRLVEDGDARDVPERRPTALLAYRDLEHEVRYLELSSLAAAIVERLLAGATLRDAITGACDAAAEPLRAEVIEGTAALLADLGERGALLGAEPPPDAPAAAAAARSP